MRPLFYRGQHTNMGDELNPYLWEKLLPPDQKQVGLLGIGTVLNERFLAAANPSGEKVIVFGSGCGFFPPPKPDNLDMMFVRGPRSAELLRQTWGYEVDWVTDPGILMAVFKKGLKKNLPMSFVPHWTTITNQPEIVGDLRKIGVETIDPRMPIENVLEMIERSQLVVAEAMHGAIVADAFRIPWIPVYGQHGHLFKWIDWCESVGMHYSPEFLDMRSMKEIVLKADHHLSDEHMFRARLTAMLERLDDLKEKLK